MQEITYLKPVTIMRQLDHCVKAASKLSTYHNQVARVSDSRGFMSLQGSTISTLLCSIFLGDLERTHLLPLLYEQPHGHSMQASARCIPGITDLAQAAGACSHANRDDTGPSQSASTQQVLEVACSWAS